MEMGTMGKTLSQDDGIETEGTLSATGLRTIGARERTIGVSFFNRRSGDDVNEGGQRVDPSMGHTMLF